MAARRNRARIVLSATFLGLAGGGVAACDSQDNDEKFYCVDQNDTIVDEDNCDDTSTRSHGGVGILPLFFLAHSARYATGLRPGTKLPPGGTKFAYNDAAARTAAGLPASGRVANGTVKSGSVGKGGSGGSGSRSSGG
jgi:hypothetical protein